MLSRMVRKVPEEGTAEQRAEDREGPAMQVSGAEPRADAKAPKWGFPGAQPASGAEGGERPQGPGQGYMGRTWQSVPVVMGSR